MIDFHSHILPMMDDGSQSIEESLWLLFLEYKHGVSKVVATPHFYAERDAFDLFRYRREESCARLRESLRGWEKVPELFIGAEVYYFPGMWEAKALPQLCIEGTRTLLLEMPFAQWTQEMKNDIQKIITERGLHVMLAHIDRYYLLQKDKRVWNEVFNLPVCAQMNAGSLMDRKRRRFSLKFLHKHTAVLGSDCHDREHRPPNLKQAREEIRKKLGAKKLAEIDHLGETILNIKH